MQRTSKPGRLARRALSTSSTVPSVDPSSITYTASHSGKRDSMHRLIQRPSFFTRIAPMMRGAAIWRGVGRADASIGAELGVCMAPARSCTTYSGSIARVFKCGTFTPVWTWIFPPASRTRRQKETSSPISPDCAWSSRIGRKHHFPARSRTSRRMRTTGKPVKPASTISAFCKSSAEAYRIAFFSGLKYPNEGTKVYGSFCPY